MWDTLKVRLADAVVTNGEVEIAWQGGARPTVIKRVLDAPIGTGDGRSEWFWLRMANGDLFLACAPQGATYESLEGEPGAGWSE